MTRINLVPPQELCDQHLLAEYRELPRVITLARIIDDVPRHFILGTGHVMFFYNKMTFLLRRYNSIVRELRKRNFCLDPHLVINVERSARKKLFSNVWFCKVYTPSKAEIAISRKRIKQRMPKKPRFSS